MDDANTHPAASLSRIIGELDRVAEHLTTHENVGMEAITDELSRAQRIFVLGAGRSGLALRMTAMRLMHLGLDVHVVGDVTTPAIAAGDVLLTASGSGATEGIVRAASTAVTVGARVAAVTTAADSPLAGIASATLVVPAAGKLDRSGSASSQYAGGLFEQTVVLVGDAVFDALWARSAQSADELWPRHSNLE